MVTLGEEKNEDGAFTESETEVPLTIGGHRHRIKTFSALKKEPTKSVYSNIFTIGGHEWQIVCYPGGETETVSEFISLFLGYRGPADRCQATWLLRCVNQLEPNVPRERKWAKGDKYNTFSVGRRWGWQKFIKREYLMDPQKGFCVNDTVIFETEVTVHGTLQTKACPRGSNSELHISIREPPHCSLGNDMLELYKLQSDLADVEFLFEDKKVLFAHSQILGARSSVFARMFGGGYMESTKSTTLVGPKRRTSSRKRVEILDVDSCIFDEFLKYVYSGRCELLNSVGAEVEDEDKSEETEDDNTQRDTIAALMEVADKYDMSRLRFLCERSLCESLTIENAASMLVMADLHSAEYLKEQALRFISVYKEEVAVTPDFSNISKNLLRELWLTPKLESAPTATSKKQKC